MVRLALFAKIYLGQTDQVDALAVAGDGDIVVAGRYDSDGFIARFDSDGSFDSAFSAVQTLDGTPNFTQGGAAVVLDADVQIFDAELSGADNFSGASVTLQRNGGANGDDEYSATGNLSALTEGGSFSVGGTNIGTVTTNSGGTLVLTFNANATNTLVNQAMQQIAYRNGNVSPPLNVTINWTFEDGNSGAQGLGGNLTANGSVVVSITITNYLPTGRLRSLAQQHRAKP